VGCRCDVGLANGQTIPTDNTFTKYTQGQEHHFRLVRGSVTRIIPTAPEIRQPPFFVVVEMEKN
jgi:hypothetical protein